MFHTDKDPGASSSFASSLSRRGAAVLITSLTIVAAASIHPPGAPRLAASQTASLASAGDRLVALRAASPAPRPAFLATPRAAPRGGSIEATLSPISWQRGFAESPRATGLPRIEAAWPMIGFPDRTMERDAWVRPARGFDPPERSRARHHRRPRDLVAALETPIHFRLKIPGDGARDLPDAEPVAVPTLATSDPAAGLLASAEPGALTIDPAAENRQAAKGLGIAPDGLRFDDRPGRLSTAAQAIEWNGQPATALGVGYTLPGGRARLDAAGVTPVTSLMAPGLATIRKTFGVSTVASLSLE